MIKYVALLFNTVALLIYQMFFADGITVTQKAPSTAKVGSQFTVELTVKKGDVDGFAKLQQDLPDGFTAEEGTTSGASFTFSNQAVKFIWMALPTDKEFKVTYKVKVDNTTIAGEKFIAGKFSYIVNNAKQQVEIAPASIVISDVPAAVATTEPVKTTTEEPVKTVTAVVADDTLISVSGFYFDEKNMPIQNLKVNLKNSAGVVLKTTTTDKDGYFIFTKLAKNNDNIVGLDAEDTHLIGKNSKADYKANNGVVLETKALEGNSLAVATTNTTAEQPVVTNVATTEPVKTTTEPQQTTTAVSGIDNLGMTCQRNAPSNVTDNSFNVEIILTKGNVSGFAKCMETLPAGFTATAVETDGSTFSFADGKVKYVWVSLPADNVVKVSYKVSVPTGISGSQKIDGSFSFIDADETRKCVFNTSTVNIGGSATTAEQPLVTNNTTTEPAKTTTEQPVVTNNTTTEPVKTTEQPQVAYQNTTTEPVKTVEQPVVTEPTKTVEQPVVTEPTKTVEQPVVTEPTKTVEQPVVTEPTKIAEQPVVTEPAKTVEQPVVTEPVVTEPIHTNEPVVVAESVKTLVQEPVLTEPIKIETEPTKATASESKVIQEVAATNVPSPKGNVSYAVQIAALRNAREPQVLASYYNIAEKVNTEMADGMTKYTVGSHSVYKEAHDAREKIKTKGVSDAWVTSYNGGKRITVQEALMISSQKWYK